MRDFVDIYKIENGDRVSVHAFPFGQWLARVLGDLGELEVNRVHDVFNGWDAMAFHLKFDLEKFDTYPIPDLELDNYVDGQPPTRNFQFTLQSPDEAQQ